MALPLVPQISNFGNFRINKGLFCLMMDGKINLEDLIGYRIKIWWPVDKKFYEGTIKSYDDSKRKHVILYDDGDVKILRLDKERWEVVDSVSKRAKKSNLFKGSPRKAV
ncbi:hypothetical protein ACFE04_004642 [Oxalis oulophora]